MSYVKSCALEQSLCRPKSKKCVEECNPVVCSPTVPYVDPCACESPMDCCSLAYQRLDKLRSAFVANLSTSTVSQQFSVYVESVDSSDTSTGSYFSQIKQRHGGNIVTPSTLLFQNSNNTSIAVQSFINEPTDTTVGSHVNVKPVIQNNGRFDNAVIAYNFVQTMRYSMFRDVVCTSADQVLGFFINPTNYQVQVLQDLSGPLQALSLTFSDTLQYYNSISTSNLTNNDKQKLASLNILYDLGISAVRRINLNPKSEGNIMKVTDRCCQEWLLVVNTADIAHSNGYTPGSNGYVIVAIRI